MLALLPFLLLAAFLLAESLRGRRRLNRRLAALQAQGEVLSVAALQPDRPLATENTSAALKRIGKALETLFAGGDLHPPALLFAAPGRVIVTATLEQWRSNGGLPGDWAAVRRRLAPTRELLAAVRAATSLPCYDSGFDYHKGLVEFRLDGITPTRQAAETLLAAMLLALRENRREDAAENLVALVRLGVNQKPEPLIVSQLVRQRVVALAWNATWQALQSPGWSDATLATLQSAWSGLDLPGDMLRACEMERAMSLEFFRTVRASSSALRRLIREREDPALAGLMPALPTRGFLLHRLHLPLWRLLWADLDATANLEQWETRIATLRQASHSGWAATSPPNSPPTAAPTEPSPATEPGWYDRLRFLFSTESIMPTPTLAGRTLKSQTQQQMALAAIAIARHRAAHGCMPAALTALVPDLLPAEPLDWMIGKPLRYRPGAQDTFLLYSVGENGLDDDGDPTPHRPAAQLRSIWDGRDAVWPTAATPEETRAATTPEADGPQTPPPPGP